MSIYDEPKSHAPDCARMAGITRMYGCTCGLEPRRQPAPKCAASDRLESPRETISRLERELAAAIQMRDRFFEAIPETFGEVFAVHPEIEKLCEPHEWDNRTTPENAAWSLLQACDLVTELEVAEQAREALRAALEAVEWIYDGELGEDYCPACGAMKRTKRHKPDCTTGIALDRPECRKEEPHG